MDGYVTKFSGLTVTNNRIDAVMADFSGMDNLVEKVDKILRKIALDPDVQTSIGMVKSGSMSGQDFDGWFSQRVRVELGKALAIIRANAVRKASEAGAGSAQTAVKRRTYRREFAENINIAGNRKRISSLRRVVPEPHGGESGIRRHRTVKPRTKKLREYYGPDRDFILRILEGGRDEFMAKSDGPVGNRSRATHGKRGAIGARNWFFHKMQSDMEEAARQLGQTLIGVVEEWVETQFEEYKGK